MVGWWPLWPPWGPSHCWVPTLFLGLGRHTQSYQGHLEVAVALLDLPMTPSLAQEPKGQCSGSPACADVLLGPGVEAPFL